MSKRNKRLIYNTLIFGVGIIGSKLISFFLVPIYTFYLDTAQYGYVDLVNTTLNLLVPIFSLCISEAVLRFALDKDNDCLVVFNTGLFSILGIGIVCFLFTQIAISLFNLTNWNIYFWVVFLQIVNTIISQYLKTLQNNFLYALNSISISIVTLAFTLIFFDISKFGKIHSYFYALIMGYLIATVFLVSVGKIYKQIHVSCFNTSTFRKMLVYTIPLIPNQLMWWVMNLSDRFFIVHKIGTSANGLYAVASKVPLLISIFITVFIQAWQISAVEERNSEDNQQFFSDVFNYLIIVSVILCSIILAFLKVIIHLLVSPDFYYSWRYVPFLLLSVLFSNFSMFVGMNYLATMKTRGIFTTSLCGGIINIILNLILIPYVGINGAGISTMISFFAVWIIRIKETRTFIKMDLKISYILFGGIVLCLQTLFIYSNLEIFSILLLPLLLFLYRTILKKLLIFIFRK